jgi:hypothetical protein
MGQKCRPTTPTEHAAAKAAATQRVREKDKHSNCLYCMRTDEKRVRLPDSGESWEYQAAISNLMRISTGA